MSWLSSGLKSIRKDLHLPPITIGNVAKAATVAAATTVGSPALGAAAAGLLGGVGGSAMDKLKTLGSQIVTNAKVTVDPIRNTFGISTGADIPEGVNNPTRIPANVDLPVYYYVAAAVVLWLLIRGLK